MPRIDARRGAVPGISRGPGPALRSTTSPVIGALGQVAAKLEQRDREAEAEAEMRQVKADRVTIAKDTADFRAEIMESYEAQAAGYDGSGPGFAQGFDEEVQRKIDERSGDADPRYADDLKLRLTNVRSDMMLSAQRYERDQQEAYTLRGAGELADTEAKAVYRNPALYGQSSEIIADMASALPEALQDDFTRQAKGTFAVSALSGYEQNDPATGLRMLKSGVFDDALDAGDIAKASSSLQAEIGRRQAAAERAAAKLERRLAGSLKTEMEQIAFNRDNGLPVSDERWQRAQSVAASIGDSQLAEVQNMRRADRVAGSLRELPLEDAQAEVDRLRGALTDQDDVGAGRAEMLVAAERVVTGMRKALDEDQIAFFMAVEGEDEEQDASLISRFLPDKKFIPLTIDASPQAVKARVYIAEERADHYGVPVKYFSKSELSLLQDAAAQDPEAALQFMHTAALAGRSGMVTEILPKAPHLAHGASLLATGGDEEFVKKIAQGKARREKGQAKTVPAASAPMKSQEVLGDALVALPNFRLGAMEAAALAYDAESARTGRGRDDFDEEEFGWALSQAVGARREGGVTYGGVTQMRHGSRRRSVLVPSDMTADQFTRAWQKMPEEQFVKGLSGTPMTGDGRDFPLSALRRGMPVAVGPGTYAIEVAPGELVSDQDGDPLTFRTTTMRRYLDNLTKEN